MLEDKTNQILKAVKKIDNSTDERLNDLEMKTAMDTNRFLSTGTNWELLEKMRYGTQTKLVFELNGVSFTLRILSMKEEREIHDKIKYPIGSPLYAYFLRLYTLSRASTPAPINNKIEGVDVNIPDLSVDTLEQMPSTFINELWLKYQFFIQSFSMTIDDISQDLIDELVEDIKKNPHLLRELSYGNMVQMIKRLLDVLKTTEQQRDSLLTTLSPESPITL